MIGGEEPRSRFELYLIGRSGIVDVEFKPTEAPRLQSSKPFYLKSE